MKLTITVTDDHSVYEHGQQKKVQRDRVVITDATGPGFVIAGILRAVADDIDPQAIGFELSGGDA